MARADRDENDGWEGIHPTSNPPHGPDGTARMDRMSTTPSALPQRLVNPTGRLPDSLLALSRSAWALPEGRVTLAGLAGCLGLLALIFTPNLLQFVQVWSRDGNYSHGFLVPLISLYFANLAAEKGPVPIRGGTLLGLAMLTTALAGRMATILVPVGIVGDFSFLLGLAGVFTLLLGTDTLRRYWFAFFFLVFMVPLPVALYARIASPLQLVVSQVATEVLNVTGVPVLREGNLMTLPGDVRMFVAEACSGMRQLTGFLALTVAVAYLASRPAWYRMAVIGSALPIAMTANITRVVLTGYIMHHLNPEFATGAFHTAEGLVMMGLGLSLLRAECWILDQAIGLGRHATPPDGSANTAEAAAEAELEAGADVDLEAGPGPLARRDRTSPEVLRASVS
jgi:exosortase